MIVSLTLGSTAPSGTHSRTAERKPLRDTFSKHGEARPAAVRHHLPVPHAEVRVGINVAEGGRLGLGMREGVQVKIEHLGNRRRRRRLADAHGVERGVEFVERRFQIEAARTHRSPRGPPRRSTRCPPGRDIWRPARWRRNRRYRLRPRRGDRGPRWCGACCRSVRRVRESRAGRSRWFPPGRNPPGSGRARRRTRRSRHRAPRSPAS